MSLRKLYMDIDFIVGDFLTKHPTIKSTWRMALFVTVAAVADHIGVSGILQDILDQTGT